MKPHPDREAASAWLATHPGAAIESFRDAFPDVPTTTLRRWFASGALPAPAPRRGPTPAAELDHDDRQRALATVRSIYSALEAYAKRLEASAEAGDLHLDAEAARAAMHLQRTAAGILEAHPGLLELVRAGEPERADDDDLDDILRALRPDKDPGSIH